MPSPRLRLALPSAAIVIALLDFCRPGAGRAPAPPHPAREPPAAGHTRVQVHLAPATARPAERSVGRAAAERPPATAEARPAAADAGLPADDPPPPDGPGPDAALALIDRLARSATPEESVACRAALAGAWLTPGAHGRLLAAVHAAPAPHARAAALAALAETWEPAGVEDALLARLAGDPSDGVRLAALSALAAAPFRAAPEVRAALAQAADLDPDPPVRDAAHDLLAELDRNP